MLQETGELLIVATARIAMALYLGSVLLQFWRRLPVVQRLLWISGFAVYVAHVGCAFQFEHGWSHARAWDHTAERTAELFGLHWGGGVWFNYAFTAVWGLDALWWIAAPGRYARRPRWVSATIHGFLGFLVFNATVVFGAWYWRGAAVVFAFLLWKGRTRQCARIERGGGVDA